MANRFLRRGGQQGFKHSRGFMRLFVLFSASRKMKLKAAENRGKSPTLTDHPCPNGFVFQIPNRFCRNDQDALSIRDSSQKSLV